MGPIAAFRSTPYAPAVNLAKPYPPNTVFPVSLTPSRPSIPLPILLSEIKQLISTGEIRKLLNEHGAIYFQNLDLANAQEFSQFAHAFGFVPHEDIGNPVRLTVLAPNVATADEGSTTQPVYPHNEFGLSPYYPAYAFFYCASAPDTGGETPINNSIVLYHQLKEEHPEFIKQLEKRGVKYQLTYANTSRTETESAGNSVLQAFGQHVLDEDDTETARAKIEKEIKRLPTVTWEWINQSVKNPLGDLRTWQVVPAIRPHPRTGQPAFFSHVASRFLYATDAEALDSTHIGKEGKYQPLVSYGDGDPIARKYFDFMAKSIKETRALVAWKKGDVMLLDNYAVQHGREPWTGERKLLISLWDLEDG